jgi:predicted nucleotidyltransferase
MLEIERYAEQINAICRAHGVKRLTLFGSALTDAFDNQSDIDFLVEFDNQPGGIKRYLRLKQALQTMFKRDVDLLMPEAIKNQRLKTYIYQHTLDCYAA